MEAYASCLKQAPGTRYVVPLIYPPNWARGIAVLY